MKRIYDSNPNWYVADEDGFVWLVQVNQETALKEAKKRGPNFTAYKDTSDSDDLMMEFFSYVDLNKKMEEL